MKKLQKGFTLIELMIVVAIIAILAAVAAPKFGQQIKKSRDAKGLAIIANWRTGNQLYYSEYEDYLPTVADAYSTSAGIGQFVDSSTVGQTVNISGATASVVVGTSADTTNHYVNFGYSLVARTVNSKVTTEGVFTIAGTNGSNTVGEVWSTK